MEAGLTDRGGGGPGREVADAMRRHTALLALTTAAALFLCYREVRSRGGFIGGLAVGALLVGLFAVWSNHCSERGRASARSLPGGSLLKGEDRVE